MLSIAGLSVSFRRYRNLLRQEEVERLSGITLDVAAGEVLAVIGSSGAGKSLLAHAIPGLLPRNAMRRGEARFRGELLDGRSLARLRGRQIALLPQQVSHLDPMARAGAQIAWAARRAGAGPAVAARLAAVGLGREVAGMYPLHLSGGMARRVMLAAAMAGDAPLLIADEPTAGLDPENRDALLARLRAYADRGRAVLLISHDLVPVLPISDRVAILDDGRLCAIAPAADFHGSGAALQSPAARALWRALPRNGFAADA